MSRTIKEIPVTGRDHQQLRAEVFRWMKDKKVELVQEKQNFIKGQVEGGVGVSHCFEISFEQAPTSIIVHTEGYLKHGTSEKAFAKRAFIAGIARMQGWRRLEDLWNRLESMSSGRPQVASSRTAEPDTEKPRAEKDMTMVKATEFFEKGVEHGNRQEWNQAISALEEAVRLKPDYAKAHQILALSYGAIMNKDSAMKHYNILLELDENLAKELADTPAFIMLQRMGGVIRT